ncbi:MAG: hypothetical protein V7L05_12480 [Nostoc sp.]|uniref:hypothetical protein n=1 Tax=Nostoc sp. TaxID=1180 RepID=UPI002FF4F99B
MFNDSNNSEANQASVLYRHGDVLIRRIANLPVGTQIFIFSAKPTQYWIVLSNTLNFTSCDRIYSSDFTDNLDKKRLTLLATP